MTNENTASAEEKTGREREDDDANALFIMGTRYAVGRDVEQDPIAAHKWFNLAAMMGHEEARQNRGELARDMSTADVAEAQRQARAWLWSRANAKATEGQAAQPATPIVTPARHTPAAVQHSLKERGSLCA